MARASPFDFACPERSGLRLRVLPCHNFRSLPPTARLAGRGRPPLTDEPHLSYRVGSDARTRSPVRSHGAWTPVLPGWLGRPRAVRVDGSGGAVAAAHPEAPHRAGAGAPGVRGDAARRCVRESGGPASPLCPHGADTAPPPGAG